MLATQYILADHRDHPFGTHTHTHTWGKDF